MVFKSKKNMVYLENDIVYKVFLTIDNLNNEVKALTLLKENMVLVPNIISIDNSTLSMEYIVGTNYSDIEENATFDEIIGLCNWIKSLHENANMSRNDFNLRNFIWDGKKCYGIDFEEGLLPLNKEKDVAEIIAYLLTNDPSFSPKRIEYVNLVLKYFSNPKLNYNFNLILKNFENSVIAMEQRRNLPNNFHINAINIFNNCLKHMEK